jgi:hypothetical protein
VEVVVVEHEAVPVHPPDTCADHSGG